MILNTILRDLEAETLLSSQALLAINAGATVEMRYTGDFESGWIAASEVVEAAWDPSKRSASELDSIHRIREISFKRVFASTGSDDLSALVSDDFDMISRAALLSLRIPFIARLSEDYYNGRIPK